MQKIKEISVILVYVVAFTWTFYYSKLPDYIVNGSTNLSSGDYRETTLNVQVYKIFGGETFYEEIAEDHNHLNGKPDRLEINLYIFNYCYHTAVFEYGYENEAHILR